MFANTSVPGSPQGLCLNTPRSVHAIPQYSVVKNRAIHHLRMGRLPFILLGRVDN